MKKMNVILFYLPQINYKKHTVFDQSGPTMYLELRSTEPTVTITELDEDSVYEFQVAAQTRLGVGLAAQLPVSTKPNGKTPVLSDCFKLFYIQHL